MTRSILIQLDTDGTPSVFDAIVAVDSGADVLLQCAEVEELNVVDHVHGALFTRGLDRLSSTAIFIGGSDLELGERLLRKVRDTFFGPFRVSVMLDSRGANTTAAAAIRCVQRHLEFGPSTEVLVLGGTGAVGRRLALLAARLGSPVTLASRRLERAEEAVAAVRSAAAGAAPHAVQVDSPESLDRQLDTAHVLLAAGAAGTELVPPGGLERAAALRVAVDLNAVPPAGIAGIEPRDAGEPRGALIAYGALGVGGLKMKLHRRAIQLLFASNEAVIDAPELLELAQSL